MHAHTTRTHTHTHSNTHSHTHTHTYTHTHTHTHTRTHTNQRYVGKRWDLSVVLKDEAERENLLFFGSVFCKYLYLFALAVCPRAQAEARAADASPAPLASEAVPPEHDCLETVRRSQQERWSRRPWQIPGQVSANTQVSRHSIKL